MREVTCQYCSGRALYIDSKVIYNGRSYGMIYLCAPCKAFVGVHPGTDKPLGVLANSELRGWKMKAHRSFDQLWKSGIMSRRKAYEWLAEKMNLPVKKTHIGYFQVIQCQEVVRLVSDYFNSTPAEQIGGS